MAELLGIAGYAIGRLGGKAEIARRNKTGALDEYYPTEGEPNAYTDIIRLIAVLTETLEQR